jgi:hypothetical protein
VRGNAPTAYLLTGRLTAALLDPDYLEVNDSFETATQLAVTTESGNFKPWRLWNVHGPGEFDLTLHTTHPPSTTTDKDYFRIDVPADLSRAFVPKLTVSSDEPVTVTLYDGARAQLATWPGVRKTDVGFPVRECSYVRVAGTTHTNYKLWVGLELSPALRRRWEELHIIPKWWEVDGHPDWITQPEEYRGIIIDEFALEDGLLGFGEASSAVLPEHVQLELLNVEGELARLPEVIDGAVSFDVEGLEPGVYVMRIKSRATVDSPIGLTTVAPRELR